MRLLEFQIERYGAIVERTITLNPAAGLAVVYGPNEIGKSTLLSGISDFFFGIPNNSPHGGVYGYDAMRLRARLVLADGTELNLRRRKGRGKTLADDVGQIYDQEVLARGLGPTTRDRFSNLFGLNHETLREGADRLLSADGEIGRLIIEAGGGLRDMVDRIAKLDPVIDGLFDLRRAGHRQFYKALDNIEIADKTAKAELVSRDAYSEVRNKCEAAQRQYDALLGNARDLAKRTSQIERLVRVQPLLSELEQLTRSLSSYAHVEALEPGFHRRIGAALDAVERCRREAHRTKDAIERLNGRRDALTTDAEWPAYEERIAALSDRAVEVRKARQSLPNRRRELGESERSLQSLRALLNLAPEACLEAIAPTPAALDAAQRLVTQAVERRAALTAQSQTARELTDDILALRESIERARAAGRDRPFGISDAELSALPEAEAGATAQGKRLAKEASDLDVCVRRIGFRDLDHIRATLLPDQDAVQAEVDLRAKLRGELEAVAGRKADAQSALRTAERQIAALEAGSILASPEALRQARDARQTALEPLVQSHLTGQLQGSQSQRADEVASLHGAVAQADDLSDRRAAESDRVAALEQHRARRDEAVCIVRDADAMIEEINGRLVATAKTFADNYPAASAVEPDPAKLRAIVTEAVRLLNAAEHLQQRLADVEVRARELEPRLQSLSIVERRCALRAGNSPTLAQRVQEAVAAVRAHDTAYEDYVRDERSLVARDAQLLRAKETISALQKEEDRWFVEWSAAATELSLEPTTSLDRAEQVLREWATARGELNNISQTRRRIEQMELDEKTLQEIVVDLSRSLEISVPAETVEAASQVKKAWESHQKRWVESIGLEPEIRTAAEEQRVAVTALATAEEALGGLSGQCSDFDGDFVGLSRRIEERDGIVDRIRQVQEQIRTAGDGFCVDELIGQCGDRDIDTLRAEHGGYDVERQKLDELTKAAIEEMQELDAALLAFDDPGKVNQAVADRECAATELHAIVEQWTEMTLARDLLKEAISRVRAEHQDPLIPRAGEFFQLTTRGAFVGVAAEVDDDGEPVVVGCRDDDSRVAIREMSDGVRDQLFLAFRLASIERYAHAAEPIPFVVDDILVNFDDDRGPATLALLAEFGRTNQVLLFTHHKAVRDAAATLLGSAEVQVIDLPARTASLDEAVRAA